MSYIMKILKKIIDKRISRETLVDRNQFSFMSGKSTMELLVFVR